jgi:alpha-beta hydrolase superfamily lysophospholipase
VNEQVGWVPTRAGEVFAGLHLPAPPARATAVLLVPPFGWEAMAAARNLRGWARALAAAGYPTVRYHPPGTGDSAGDGAAQDLLSWSAALTDLAAHTRAATGCTRLAVVGLGLGGLVALQAVHDGCPVEDLVLWAVPGRGRLLLRELRVIAAMTSEPGDPAGPAPTVAPAPPTDGLLWVHGYPLGGSAQQQLAALDARTLDLSGVQRALVLGRGTLPHDARLLGALTAAGVDASVEPGRGYDELTVEPRLSQPATEVVARVQHWLRPDQAATVPGPLPAARTSERRLTIGPVDAVLTVATDPVLTAVFVGAGATPRPGPNRLWTEAARRWAPWGVASLRLDLHGIGEAAGPDTWQLGPEGFYDESYRPQVRAALEAAVAEGLPDRFLLVGLCSGGLWAAQLALEDPRVAGVVLLNPGSLVWPPPLGSADTRQHLFSRATWSRLLRDPKLRQEVRNRARRSAQLLGRRVAGAPRGLPANTQEVLAALGAAGVPVLLGVSPGEAGLEDLQGLPPGGALTVRLLDGPTGAHTLSPAVLREQAEQLLDEAARRVLDAVRAPAAG